MNTSNLLSAIKKMGLGAFAADMLEMGEPLAVLGAQMLYIFEPLTGAHRGDVRALGRSLEDPQRYQSLVRELRLKETHREQS